MFLIKILDQVSHMLDTPARHYTTGEQKFPEFKKKKLFKIVIQAWNFTPLQSTPPGTRCNDPSTTPAAGNIV